MRECPCRLLILPCSQMVAYELYLYLLWEFGLVKVGRLADRKAMRSSPLSTSSKFLFVYELYRVQKLKFKNTRTPASKKPENQSAKYLIGVRLEYFKFFTVVYQAKSWKLGHSFKSIKLIICPRVSWTTLCIQSV